MTGRCSAGGTRLEHSSNVEGLASARLDRDLAAGGAWEDLTVHKYNAADPSGRSQLPADLRSWLTHRELMSILRGHPRLLLWLVTYLGLAVAIAYAAAELLGGGFATWVFTTCVISAFLFGQRVRRYRRSDSQTGASA